MREVCNLGYGRAVCERFPRDSAASDAIRFHIAKDDGELVKIQYVFERECWPAAHGSIECTVAHGAISTNADEILRRQAEAFLESYIRRRDAA